MNAQIKKEWLEALRSGEFLQGTGRLRYSERKLNGQNVKRHCCLGVLCEIVKKHAEFESMVQEIEENLRISNVPNTTVIDIADSS